MPLTFEESQPLVGEQFTVHTQQGLIPLTLTEAQERPRRGLPEQFRTPLSLIFTGPASVPLNQDCYFLEHPQTGMRQWMIVPILPPLPSPSSLAPSDLDNTQQHLCYYQVLFG